MPAAGAAACIRQLRSSLIHPIHFTPFTFKGTTERTLIEGTSGVQKVYELMNLAFEKEEKEFRAYPRLALAIVLVYDQPPPRDWPHYQVPPDVLLRVLPDPVKALRFWAEAAATGKTLHPSGSRTPD